MSLTNIDGKLMDIGEPGLVPGPVALNNAPAYEPEPEAPEPEYTPEPTSAEAKPEPVEANTDDYGTEIAPQEKVYTQAEVDSAVSFALKNQEGFCDLSGESSENTEL